MLHPKFECKKYLVGYKTYFIKLQPNKYCFQILWSLWCLRVWNFPHHIHSVIFAEVECVGDATCDYGLLVKVIWMILTFKTWFEYKR